LEAERVVVLIGYACLSVGVFAGFMLAAMFHTGGRYDDEQ
jgi:hypothetical protein